MGKHNLIYQSMIALCQQLSLNERKEKHYFWKMSGLISQHFIRKWMDNPQQSHWLMLLLIFYDSLASPIWLTSHLTAQTGPSLSKRWGIKSTHRIIPAPYLLFMDSRSLQGDFPPQHYAALNRLQAYQQGSLDNPSPYTHTSPNTPMVVWGLPFDQGPIIAH